MKIIRLVAIFTAVSFGNDLLAVTVIGSGSLPLVINAPGAYRLDRNLTLADPNVTAIEINVGNVTLDLDGHTITGPNTCTAFPGTLMVSSCIYDANSSSGKGIRIFYFSSSPVSIKDGTISKMASQGLYSVFSDSQVNVENVNVNNSGAEGIAIGSGMISKSTAQQNLYEGLVCDSCEIVDSYAVGNGQEGISIGSGIGRDLIATQNGTGIVADPGSALFNISTYKNKALGGEMGHGANVEGARVNGLLAYDNDGDGLYLPLGSTWSQITDSSAFGNAGYGFRMNLIACWSRISAFNNTLGQITPVPANKLANCNATR